MDLRVLLLWLLSAAGFAVTPGELRHYQLLVEATDGPGCALTSPTGDVIGQAALIELSLDQQDKATLVYSRCVDGSWQHVARQPIAGSVVTRSAGVDTLNWSIPRSWLGVPRPLGVRILAQHPASGSVDHHGAEQPAVVNLPLGEAPVPIPLWNSGVALGCLLGICLLAARWRRTHGLAGLLVLLLLPVGQAERARAAGNQTQDPVRAAGNAAGTALLAPLISLLDPAGDQFGNDAGIDLQRVELALDAQQLQVQLQVRALPEPVPLRVLFLGNSLTAANTLPLMVQAIAAQAGETIQVTEVSFGGVNLEDLYREGTALSEISSGRYQWVIMQQGPSSLAESQEDLERWTIAFNTPIRASGARPALYMVWPERARFSFFNAVRTSYLNAALSIEGWFIPAGETWRTAWRERPQLALYGADQFHPSALGSYAAALTIYCTLFGRSPEGLPASLVIDARRTLQFDAADALLVQRSAWATHLQYARAGQ